MATNRIHRQILRHSTLAKPFRSIWTIDEGIQNLLTLLGGESDDDVIEMIVERLMNQPMKHLNNTPHCLMPSLQIWEMNMELSLGMWKVSTALHTLFNLRLRIVWFNSEISTKSHHTLPESCNISSPWNDQASIKRTEYWNEKTKTRRKNPLGLAVFDGMYYLRLFWDAVGLQWCIARAANW